MAMSELEPFDVDFGDEGEQRQTPEQQLQQEQAKATTAAEKEAQQKELQQSEEKQEAETPRAVPKKVTRKKLTPEELNAVDVKAPQYYLYRNREVDLSLWDEVMLTLTFPIGLLRAFLVFSFLGIWLLVASVAHALGLSDQFNGATGGFCNWLALHIAGFFFKIKGLKHYKTALQHGKEEDRALLVISNHISALDPHAASGALWSCFRPVVKSGVFDIPMYGSVAKVLGSIGVDRSKASGVVNRLRKYFDDSSAGSIPVYMCPEGTTANGDGLIRFKRGTFLTDVEVLPVCLQYECPDGISVCLNQPVLLLDILQIIRFMSCLPPKYIHATVLPPMRRRANEDYQEFADRVGRAMADAMNIPYELNRTHDEAIKFYAALEHQYRNKTGAYAPKRQQKSNKNKKQE